MPGAGTDKTKRWSVEPAPIVVLVEPQMGENIGATARAMANFGISRLRLVKPVQGWPNEKARVMAAGTSRSGRCVVTSATRSGASPRVASIITTRGVPVRPAKNSVCPTNGMPASRIVPFCTGPVTSAAIAPVAHASHAASSEDRTLRAFVGSGWPGTGGAASG